MDERADELFDEVEDVLPQCEPSHIRMRIDRLTRQLNAIDSNRGGNGADARAELVRHAQSLMTRNMQSPLTITQVATACNASPTALKQAFRTVAGVPVYQWYRACRMERARGLLRETTLPIAQVAASVGYSNPSKFAKAFREETGMLPRAWRAIAREQGDGALDAGTPGDSKKTRG